MQAFITKHRKGIKRMLIGCGIVIILSAAVIFGMDVYVVHYAKGYVYETGQENSMPKADCILVLGAGMKPNGEPSLMLRDRLNRAIELYRAGVSDRFLLTGDHGRKGYNEVQGMKDYIMANPPFNLSNWGAEQLKDDVRWQYGMPPASNANFAWLQHMIYHLAPGGRMGMVLANGSLSSQSGGEGDIRKNIVNDDLVDCIIAMPTQLFYTTQIPVSLWFISKRKKQPGKTLFIDARKMGVMVSRKLRELTDEDIKKISDTYNAYVEGTLEDVKGFCAVVDTEKIAEQDYILTPGRYVGVEEQEDDGEPFEEKMARLTSELSDLFKQSHKLEAEIKEKLGAIGYEI